MEIPKSPPVPMALSPKANEYVMASPRRVSALYDYPAENPHELGFHEGDTIEVVNTFNNSGWWYGKLDGKYGIFPSNYCTAAEQRRLKKRENTSMFIKKMQKDLGFVKNKPNSEENSLDGAEENAAYQQMMLEMKEHIESLEKQITNLEADRNEQKALIGELTAKLSAAPKEEQHDDLNMQAKLLEELEQNASQLDEALAIISNLRGQINVLEESRIMLNAEVEDLSTKLLEALRKEEDAVMFMEEQQKQLSEHGDRNERQSAMEANLATQLDEALKKEEEAYTLLSQMQHQITEHEQRNQAQAAKLEQLNSQLTEAHTKEKTAEAVISDQYKRLTEIEGMFDNLSNQLQEAQKREREVNETMTIGLESARRFSAEGTELLQRRPRSMSTEALLDTNKDNSSDNDKQKPQRSRTTYYSSIFFLVVGVGVGLLFSTLFRC